MSSVCTYAIRQAAAPIYWGRLWDRQESPGWVTAKERAIQYQNHNALPSTLDICGEVALLLSVECELRDVQWADARGRIVARMEPVCTCR